MIKDITLPKEMRNIPTSFQGNEYENGRLESNAKSVHPALLKKYSCQHDTTVLLSFFCLKEKTQPVDRFGENINSVVLYFQSYSK
jgi:hypothetical protein